ncbi:MAG: DUF3341 domain-containing protein [Polyangiaceae bacterium]
MRSGVMAEFDSMEAMVLADERLRSEGYTRLRSFTPYPVRTLVEQLPASLVPWMMLAAGLLGGGLGYFIQYACNGLLFPIDVGGRPLNPVPALIPITFESAVLAASLTGFFAVLAFSGLPRLSHPVFEVDGFDRAFVDRFWIGVDDSDPKFAESVSRDLAGLGALRCERVGGPARQPTP